MGGGKQRGAHGAGGTGPHGDSSAGHAHRAEREQRALRTCRPRLGVLALAEGQPGQGDHPSGHQDQHPEPQPFNSCVLCHAERRGHGGPRMPRPVPDPGDVALPGTRDSQLAFLQEAQSRGHAGRGRGWHHSSLEGAARKALPGAGTSRAWIAPARLSDPISLLCGLHGQPPRRRRLALCSCGPWPNGLTPVGS